VKTKKDLCIPFGWEERRHVFLDRFFYIPKKYDSAQKGELCDWSSPLIFGREAPIWLECCSGNGEWIVERAKAHPEYNWVAVEIRFDRARKIWLRAQAAGLSNLYVVCAEASEFLRYYVPKASIASFFVNFPDPWPKRHHAKHRLIQAPFVSLVADVLQATGSITLVTDSEPYRDQMLSEFRLWRSHFPEPFYGSEFASYGSSFFGTLWTAKGRDIFTLRYQHEMD